MKMRLLALFLALTLLVSPVPAVRAEERAAQPGSIEEQIRAYAKSIDQSGAESSAAMALATHGMTGGGKKLKMGEESALTAVLLNSNQFQYWLVKSCTKTIEFLQSLDLKATGSLRGWSIWEEGRKTVALSHFQNSSSDSRDWSFFGQDYPGEWNSYDRSLEWMAGITYDRLNITQLDVKDHTAVYQVELRILDDFDFTTAGNSGFKEFLSGVGMVMFKEFAWECQVTFTLEVPYSCPHGPRSYRWSYDPQDKTMTSDTAGGYTENRAELRVTDDQLHYYALEETVRLLHDRPWVLEYDVLKPGYLSLAPVEKTCYTNRTSILHSKGYYLLVQNKEYQLHESDDGTTYCETVLHRIRHKISALTPSPSKNLLTYRLENQVNPDGSNMIYLSILNPVTETVLVDRLAVDDYYQLVGKDGEAVLISEESDWLSGQDIYINYIGNQSYDFYADHFELRIREDTADPDSERYYRHTATVQATCTEDAYTEYTCFACGHSYRVYGEPARGHRYVSEVTAPTCTEGGFTTCTCQCGDSYMTDQTDPLGHDLTEWAATVEPGCTEDGSEERRCLRCGYSESRVIEATGHRYEAFVTEPGCTTGGYTDYICSCGDRYRTSYTNPTGHHYEAAVTEPTCTEGGFTTYTCACGAGYVSNYTAALGHEYADGACIRCAEADPNRRVNPFIDVPEGSFYYEPVLWAVENGITTGATGTTFNPDGQCQRAAVVTFLWRSAGCPEPGSAGNPFADVKQTDFFYKAVLWAVEQGITTGADAAHFNPYGICNRAQVVTFLYRAFGNPAVENAANPFTDVPGGTWYTAPVLWAVEQGITNGVDATRFGPDSPCNRAQVVTFLHRAYT